MCRGIIKLKREVHEAVRVVASISSDVRRRLRDPEEFHEESEACIPMHHTIYNLNKLTCHKTSKGDVTSALAWDDLTGMRLDADMVIEARAKEVQYIKDKRVYSKVTRKEAQAK